MKDGSKLGRRGFLGTSLAIAAGASAGVALSRRGQPVGHGARFAFGHGVEAHVAEDTRAFPDCPVTVEVGLPSAREGARGTAWLHIRTPTEHIVKDLGEVRFQRGQALIETTLAYPYEGRVPGAYSYHVEVACAGERIVTVEPATYSLRKIHWFS